MSISRQVISHCLNGDFQFRAPTRNYNYQPTVWNEKQVAVPCWKFYSLRRAHVKPQTKTQGENTARGRQKIVNSRIGTVFV